ncbi:MAG: hypothetical protein FJ128_09380 [Deltaproteobacteria bacterium]|nr:hypothetical protein [Deltaproteobacteria bacterium]
MTQALAAFNAHGLVLATDSRATRFGADGRPEYFAVKKLFPLGRRLAVLSGGAGVSVPLSLALKAEVARRRGLEDPDDLLEFALPFLSRGYARHLEAHSPGPEGLQRIYFILAGFSPELAPPGYRLYLLGSEEGELPLRLSPPANQLVMPRHLGMEMRLVKVLAQEASLAELLAISREFLEKQAQAKEEVAPPFYFATITPAGYREVVD